MSRIGSRRSVVNPIIGLLTAANVLLFIVSPTKGVGAEEPNGICMYTWLPEPRCWCEFDEEMPECHVGGDVEAECSGPPPLPPCDDVEK